MSSGSDNEEFYDACDVTPLRNKCLEEVIELGEKLSEGNVGIQKILALEPNDLSLMPPPKNSKFDGSLEENKNKKEDSSSTCSESLLCQLGQEEAATDPRMKWHRRRERRHRMTDDDDDVNTFPPSSPGESQSSSIDAVFPANRTLAPFRVIEVDATSVYSTTFSQDKGSKSLSQSAPKIEAKEEISVKEKTDSFQSDVKDYIMPLSPEPDIVASTKSNSLPRNKESVPPPFEFTVPAPIIQTTIESESQILRAINQELTGSSKTVFYKSKSSNNESLINSKIVAISSAPIAPPRKYKRQRKTFDDDAISSSSMSLLPPPGISFLSKAGDDGITNALNIQTATQGDFIVRPQDTASCKALGPSDYVHIESDTTSQASTPETSRNTPKCIAIPPTEKIHEILSTTDSLNSVYLSGDADPQLLPPTVKIQLDTGKSLTDEEILCQVSVLNLDTGERIPLSEADDSLPPALNPLSLHIMKLASEYSRTGMEPEEESDEESIAEPVERKISETDTVSVKKKTTKIKNFLGRKVESAVARAKILAQEVSRVNKEEKDIFEDVTPAQNVMQYVKIKTSHSHKGPIEFDNLMYIQELKGEHTGPVWCMKFSPCGRLLATAGQDHVLRVWVLKQAFNYFLDIRTKWNADVKASPTPSQESLVSQQSSHSSEDIGTLDPNDDGSAPFMTKPFCTYTGHTADVLDLSWSNNYFMLTSSMDKTVRLWHISRKECLCIFKHVDFVTAIAFHPKDDRYFISGSLDGKLRLWSIPDKQVVMWNEVEGHPKLITAANFCQNGIFTVVGTYNGRCIFYKTDDLKYYTQIHVKSSRGKNARGGRKITGIEPLPDENKLMITSNDSRIRLYNLGVLNMCCKYKGCSNMSSQIKASFSHDGKYIVCGSENQCMYIWKTNHDYSKFSSARKDRNTYWEGVKAHNAVVTCAIFSPRPNHVFNFIEQQQLKKEEKKPTKESSNNGYVLVSADFNGCIKVFMKKEKPKHSSLPASAIA